MKLELYVTPIDAPLAVMELTEPRTIGAVLREAKAEDWFGAEGRVLLDGRLVAPDTWDCHILEPASQSLVQFVAVPQGKKTLALLATVAVVALTGFVGAGGLALMGLSATLFGAGTIGASLLSAGIGLAGSLLIGALTAPPRSGNRDSGGQGLSSAGINGNSLALLETLPVVLGTIGYSPPHLMPPYTTYANQHVTVHACLGVEGRCAISGVKINGQDAANFAGAVVETREGVASDVPPDLLSRMVVEQRPGLTLSKFMTAGDKNRYDMLLDQAVPDNSASQWHVFRSDGVADELRFRLLISGLAITDIDETACLALRLEARKVGDTAWRAFPTMHMLDKSKGRQQIRAEVRLKFSPPPNGTLIARNSSFPVFGLVGDTSVGKAWAYSCDAYFKQSTYGILPVMTAATTAGVTITASATDPGASASSGRAYHAADRNSATYWGSGTNPALPAWWKIDCGTERTIRSYSFYWLVYRWNLTFEGSHDGVTWEVLDSPGQDDLDSDWVFRSLSAPVTFRYFRFVYSSRFSPGSTSIIVLGDVYLYEQNAAGLDYSANALVPGTSGASLDQEGVTFYLDPAQGWDVGEYEFRIKRSWVFRYSIFNIDTYSYASDTNKAAFFDYSLSSGSYVVFEATDRFVGDLSLEVFQTIRNQPPFDPGGIAYIALSVPDTQIESVYAEFSRYAPVFANGIWDAVEVQTRNPAALYRQILLGGANQRPVPGDCIDDEALAAWFQRCAVAGHECNAVLQGARVGDARQLIATAGYAAPRDAELYGVIEDRDTSADPVRYAVTPMNSQDAGNAQALPELPDAIRAEFFNAALNYAVDHVLVYRDGKTAETAKVIETIQYQGFTDAVKVTSRAAFDLAQAVARQSRYTRRIGIEGFLIRRGDVLQLIDDVVDRAVAVGRILSVTKAGGFITALTLDNIMPFGASSDIEALTDVAAVVDIEHPAQTMGIAIRIPGAPLLNLAVAEVSDSNTATLATPLADDGSIVPGLLCGAGPMAAIGRRVKVMSVRPEGFDARVLELADEAPELFA